MPVRLTLALIALAFVPALAPLPTVVAGALRAPLLLWLPGWLLLRATGAAPALGPAGRAGLALTLSVACSAIALDLLALVGLRLETLVAVAATLSAVAAIALLRRAAAGTAAGSFDVAVAAVAIVIALGSLARGSTVAPGTDTGTHLTILTRVVETGRPLVASPFFAEPVGWQYADAWHRLLAVLAGPSGPTVAELVATWHFAGALAALAAVLAFAGFARVCLEPGPALLATVAQVAVLPLDHLAFPAGIGRALMWAALALALAGIANGDRAARILAVVAVVGCASLHPIEAYLFVAAIGAYGLVALLASDRQLARRAITLSFAAAALAAPVIVAGNRFLLDQVGERELIDPSFELRELIADVWIVAPRFWQFDPASPIVWLALAAIPIVWRRAEGPARSVVVASLLVVFTGLLFPPLAALVVHLNLPSFLLARAGVLFPAGLLAGAAVATLAGRIRVVAAVVVIVAVGAELVPWALAPAPRSAVWRHPLLGAEGAAALASLPRGSVILTDLWSADFVAAAGGHYAVAAITWHSASTRDQLATWDFFTSAAQPASEAVDLLARRRVDAILLTDWQQSGLDWPGYGSDFRPPYADHLLAANATTFTLAGETEALRLYRVADTLPATLAGKAGDRHGEPSPAPESLLDLGDLAVVAAARKPGAVIVELRARRTTRAAPMIAAIAVAPEFAEHSALDRILRKLRGRPALSHAAARLDGFVRIDDRFYTDRALCAGDAVKIVLPIAAGEHDRVWVGPADRLPPFPRPLSPALEARFIAVRPPE